MNIETIFHDYKELNTLAKESSEHPHIGKTNLQKDLETVQILDDNVADITAITLLTGVFPLFLMRDLMTAIRMIYL